MLLLDDDDPITHDANHGWSSSKWLQARTNDLKHLLHHLLTVGTLVVRSDRCAEIRPEFIRYRVTGTVNVQLHYGGKSDPVQMEETFLFTCTIKAKVVNP